MKYLFLLFLFANCQKNTKDEVPLIQSSPTLHTIELKWITSASTKREYTYPSAQNQNYLISKIDTVNSSSSIIYSYKQGIPVPYSHSLDGYCYNSTSDSIEVQILIDGILKAKKKEQGFVSVNYSY